MIYWLIWSGVMFLGRYLCHEKVILANLTLGIINHVFLGPLQSEKMFSAELVTSSECSNSFQLHSVFWLIHWLLQRETFTPDHFSYHLSNIFFSCEQRLLLPCLCQNIFCLTLPVLIFQAKRKMTGKFKWKAEVSQNQVISWAFCLKQKNENAMSAHNYMLYLPFKMNLAWWKENENNNKTTKTCLST